MTSSSPSDQDFPSFRTESPVSRNPSVLGKLRQLVTLGSRHLRGNGFLEAWEPLREPRGRSDTW